MEVRGCTGPKPVVQGTVTVKCFGTVFSIAHNIFLQTCYLTRLSCASFNLCSGDLMSAPITCIEPVGMMWPNMFSKSLNLDYTPLFLHVTLCIPFGARYRAPFHFSLWRSIHMRWTSWLATRRCDSRVSAAGSLCDALDLGAKEACQDGWSVDVRNIVKMSKCVQPKVSSNRLSSFPFFTNGSLSATALRVQGWIRGGQNTNNVRAWMSRPDSRDTHRLGTCGFHQQKICRPTCVVPLDRRHTARKFSWGLDVTFVDWEGHAAAKKEHVNDWRLPVTPFVHLLLCDCPDSDCLRTFLHVGAAGEGDGHFIMCAEHAIFVLLAIVVCKNAPSGFPCCSHPSRPEGRSITTRAMRSLPAGR